MSWLLASLWAGVALWAGLLLWNIWNARGYFSVSAQQPFRLRELPRVSILVPARNEAGMLPATLPGMLSQDYPDYEVILVDDGSTDDTGLVAEEVARKVSNGAPERLRVIRVTELPPGWIGKNHALHTAFESAARETQAGGATASEWVLATDADIRFHPQALRAGLWIAEQHQADLVTIYAFMECESFWEKLLLPGFGLLISTVFPQRLINDPRSSVSLASGGYILMRRSVWAALGGYRAIQSEMIDDLNTARLVKHSGHRIFAAATRDLVRTRMYTGFGEVWEGLRKNAFAGHRYSVTKLLAAAGGFLLCNLLPLAVLGYYGLRWATGGGAAEGPEVTAVALAAGEYLLAGLAHLPLLVYLGVGAGFGLLAPLGATIYAVISFDSMIRTLLGSGVTWKMRQYSKPVTDTKRARN